MKGLFYLFIGKKGVSSANSVYEKKDSIVIFCEGKNYWNTFKPVIEALLAKGQPLSYYTMDVDDPCLTIENDLINNRYIGKNNMAFAKMGKLSADVVLSTTPNIGSENFPLIRSPKIKCLVHVFHSPDDIAYYYKGSLDHYDAVLLNGEFHISIIRKLEKIRNLPQKELIPAGLPYLDVLASKMKQELLKTDGNTLLVAPSWGSKSCLNIYGWGFIADLAKSGFNVIVRPHPQSWKIEKSMLGNMCEELSDYKNVSIDSELDGALSMEKSDLLISDTSAIRLDYALLYQRPVVTLESIVPDPDKFEISDLKEAYMEKSLNEIGYTINKNNINKISDYIKNILNSKTNYDLASFRENTVYNWGKSGEVIANFLINKSKELSELSEASK